MADIITVLLIEHQPLTRLGVKTLLASVDDIELMRTPLQHDRLEPIRGMGGGQLSLQRGECPREPWSLEETCVELPLDVRTISLS